MLIDLDRTIVFGIRCVTKFLRVCDKLLIVQCLTRTKHAKITRHNSDSKFLKKPVLHIHKQYYFMPEKKVRNGKQIAISDMYQILHSRKNNTNKIDGVRATVSKQ